MILNSKNEVKEYYLDKKKRNLVLILPGGGYHMTSEREAKPIADIFYEKGYHAAVYYYRNELLKHPDVINEAIEVVRMLKKQRNVNKVIVIGFSAGGHLALHLLTKIPKQFASGILCYPVVSTNPKYYHGKSFFHLLGDKINDKKSLKEVSLEKQIKKTMPPVFIWHTYEDSVVPVENAYLLIEALKKKNVPTEAHIFQKGPHGLSTAQMEVAYGDDKEEFVKDNKHIAIWTILMFNWLEKNGL